jgi:ribonuclease G
MNPKVSAYFTGEGARMLHLLEEETNRFFHFTGSEGLPLDHFAIVEEGARAEIEEQSVPFREGEEVHVDIIEPHMYSEDDAVAKVDGYLIEVADGISYVGEKMLVRIVQADRTAARAVLAEVAEEAAAASEERRKTRERSAKRAASAPPSRARRTRKPATQESQAVEALTEGGVAHAGTGPGAADDSDEDTAKPSGRRRSRSRGGSGSAKSAKEEGSGEQEAVASRNVAEGEGEERAARVAGETDSDDAVQSKPRRRGRRGGRRRSRANAEVAPEASE